MAKFIRKKFTPEQVKAYEEMSGFKTTGEVYVQTWDKKTQKKIDKIMDDLYLPPKDDKLK